MTLYEVWACVVSWARQPAAGADYRSSNRLRASFGRLRAALAHPLEDFIPAGVRRRGRALRSGRLGGAVLDTFREEPLPPTSPLYDLPNVILTPHTSWSSTRVLDRSVELFCENLRRFAEGRPLVNVVDPDAGY